MALLAPGETAPDCLALLEGNGRYAITFPARPVVPCGRRVVPPRRGRRRNAQGNIREEAWQAAMSIKDHLTGGRGCYVIP